MQIQQKAYGEDHPGIATELGNLGLIYYDQGKLELAEQNYLKAIQIQKNAFGEDHPGLAD